MTQNVAKQAWEKNVLDQCGFHLLSLQRVQKRLEPAANQIRTRIYQLIVAEFAIHHSVFENEGPKFTLGPRLITKRELIDD